jgi:hypothetical protein
MQIKAYVKAILKVVWPLALMLIVNDCFAIGSGDDGLDEMANNLRQVASGGYMPVIVLTASVVGIVTAIMQQSLMPLGIAAVIIAAAKLFSGYAVSAFGILI